MGNGQAGIELRRVCGATLRTLSAAERERGGDWPACPLSGIIHNLIVSLYRNFGRHGLGGADDGLTNWLPLLNEYAAPLHAQTLFRKELHRAWVDFVLLHQNACG